MSNNQEAPLPNRRIPVRAFLNYASEDRERAVRLHDKLIEAGLDEVWFDHTDIEGGDRWKNEIDDGLRRSTLLLAMLTKASMDPSREWIEYERTEAKRLLMPIIPLRFEGEPPDALKKIHYIDFAVNPTTGLSKLLDAIRKYALRHTSRAALPGEPPPLLDAFVGRQKELEAVFEMIDCPPPGGGTGRQSIAIQGMGGQGKSMLAREFIRRIVLRYPGGLIFEERGESRKPAKEVLQDWARLALGDAPARLYEAADVRALLASYGELLVLIDDVSESDFKETRKLLEALPPDATRLMTTRSRDIASVLGCRMYVLSQLNNDDACELVRNRLSAMNSTAAPDDPIEQDKAIQRLVDLVQGHALALELASARCDSPADLPDVVDQLATSLAEGVDELAVDLADEVGKDDSLEVSLNISLKQLMEHDQNKKTNWAERFAALGVFPDNGPMNLRLLAAIWGDDGERDKRTTKALSGLFRRAMIKQEPETEIYRNHPLLSAFARSLLRKQPDRMAETQRRYRDFLTRTAEQNFSKPEDHWSQMELYTPHLLHIAAGLWDECTNLLGDLNALAEPKAPAAGIALEDPEASKSAMQAAGFAHAVMPYVLRRPALGENGRRLLTLGLACVRATGNEELMDTFVRALGVWYARGKTEVAEHYFEQAVRWAEQTGDRAEQGKVLSDYGELQRNRTRFDDAIKLLERALVIHEQLADQRMQAVTLKSLGEAYGRQCHFETAMKHYQRAIELYKTLGDRSGEADLHNKIGSVEFNRGDYQAAIDKFEVALPMHVKLGNHSMEGEDRNDMGISYTYLQQPERALPLLEQAIEIHSQLGNRRLEAIAISNRAGTYYMLGQQDPSAYETALLDARKAGAVARDVEDKLTEVWALNWEALAQEKLGRPELALPLLEHAETLLDDAGPRERVSTWGNLGYLLGKHLEQRERGAELLGKAIDLMRKRVFTRAFGARTLADLEALLREFNA